MLLSHYTPGRGKIVPLNVIKETSQVTGKAYEILTTPLWLLSFTDSNIY